MDNSIEQVKQAAATAIAKQESQKPVPTVEQLPTLNRVESLTAMAVFGQSEGVEPLISAIEAEALSLVADPACTKGRAEIKSLAYKVSRTKTGLDQLGKDLVAGKKAEVKAIDIERKAIRDRLDALRDKVRTPLTRWEEEQKRIEKEKAEAEAAAQLKAKIEQCHETALLMNELHDKRVAEEEQAKIKAKQEAKKKADAERAAREKQIAEDARIEAERKANEEKLAAEQAAAKAKAESEAAEARRKLEAKQAKERAERAKKKAEAEKVAAVQAEKDRNAAEAKAKAEAEAKREADKKHFQKVMGDAKQAFMKLGIEEDLAKAAIQAIHAGEVPHVSVKF